MFKIFITLSGLLSELIDVTNIIGVYKIFMHFLNDAT